MLRFLLALIAVMTGLAASGEPVSARVCGDKPSAVGVIDCGEIAEQVASVPAAAAAPEVPASVTTAASPLLTDTRSVAAPAVRLRADRALE